MTGHDLLTCLAGGLIVSCQADASSPLRDSGVIARLALCAELGGAVALRVDSPGDIRAVRELCTLPVLGLHKRPGSYRPLITTSFDDAAGLVAAGADLVAIEVSPDSPDAVRLIERVARELGVPVVADVATLEAGEQAVAAGAQLVATTLSGYLHGSAAADGPDVGLVRHLAGLGIPVVAEGRYRTRDQVAAAFAAGAHAVVVGSAITDPRSTTSWFAAATPSRGVARS